MEIWHLIILVVSDLFSFPNLIMQYLCVKSKNWCVCCFVQTVGGKGGLFSYVCRWAINPPLQRRPVNEDLPRTLLFLSSQKLIEEITNWWGLMCVSMHVLKTASNFFFYYYSFAYSWKEEGGGLKVHPWTDLSVNRLCLFWWCWKKIQNTSQIKEILTFRKKGAEPWVYITKYILIHDNTVRRDCVRACMYLCVSVCGYLWHMPRTQKYAELISLELTGPKGLWGSVFFLFLIFYFLSGRALSSTTQPKNLTFLN